MADAERDPADDPTANYDYRNDEVERPDLVSDLRGRIDGDVRFDDYSRQLYATDASIYEVTPIGVVFPRSTADVAATVRYCAERDVPVLPRGGGTSLAGQAVNEAVVLDFARHMDSIRTVDAASKTARVQPGVTLGTLNEELRERGLKFAPDPAWGDKSTLGGAIGNNSSGAHSLEYGKTDAYVERCEVVLADGTITTFEDVPVEDVRVRADADGDLKARIYDEVRNVVDEKADAVRDAYPDITRSVSGYNLDYVVESAIDGTVPMGRLLAGSEGTLAIVTEATVSLEPIPETTGLAMLCYDDLLDAMADVATLLEHDPAAVELVDDVLLRLARESAEFADIAAMVPDGTEAALLVEFYAEDDAEGRERVANLLADRLEAPDPRGVPASERNRVTTGDPVRAFSALEAHGEAKQAKIWKLRKSGLPILLSRTTDEKHVAFIEDTAVPPEHLADYVRDFRDILDEHDTYASFYAHAGPGVLHIRPLVNAKAADGVETMEAIADAVTDLVVRYGGSVSGEHGDGRARTQWNRRLFGDEIWRSFVDLKEAFDPDWLLNPGQVCGLSEAERAERGAPRRSLTVEMTDHHRYGPDYSFDADFDGTLNWDNDDGFQGMVELCHGCGGCRGQQDTTGSVMCPTYRAADEEITSTRGRANALRQAMSGDLPGDPFSEEFVREVLDLCIGCKGCARDCPSEVDMAKLKAELTHEYHQREGASLRDRLFANVDLLSRVGSATAPLSNWLGDVPGVRGALSKAVGIAADRSLPTFQRETLRDWFAEREPDVAESEAVRKAVLFPDTYTNYSNPSVGKAAVRLLEDAGVHVDIPALTDSGRPAHSKGFLDASRATARRNVDRFVPRIREGWDIVVVEPSDAVMFQSDYLDLLSGPEVETVAANAYGVCEYLDAFGLDDAIQFTARDDHVTYHGHCHQKATKKDHHAVSVLRRAGFAVDPLDSGCCGMAGSFGYEAEHRSLSFAIGRILAEQVDASPGETVVAPGASCRTQLDDLPTETRRPVHPVEMLAAAARDGSDSDFSRK